MEYRRTVIINDRTAADGTYTDELPVNALSHLIYTIKALNAGAMATLAQLLGAIEGISIASGGRTFVSLSAADLFAMNVLMMGFEPIQENVVDTDNAVRAISLILPFGRKLYDPEECFPPTKRGELFLEHTVDIADTGYDGLILQVEAVELPGAQPKNFLHYTTNTHTPTATGASQADLPIGDPYLGILLFSTTVPTGTAWTASADQVTLLADNLEKYYRAANWESLHGDSVLRGAPVNQWAAKFHTENTGATYAQNADTASEEPDDSDVSNYAYLDLDPNRDGMFQMETKGLSSLSLQFNAGDTNAIRIVPIRLHSAAELMGK